MDELWARVIKATGAVGVIGFLVYFVLGRVYSKEIVELFGSDRMFIVTLVIIAFLSVILLVAVLKGKGAKAPSQQNKPEGPKVTYSGNSTHNGDNNF